MTDSTSSNIFLSLSDATQLNSKAAKFLAGGVILLMLTAQIISLKADTGTMIFMACVILAFSIAVPLFRFIIHNPMQRAVLTWALTFSFLALLAGFLNAALPWPQIGNPTEPACYWRTTIGLQSRKACEAERGVTTDVISSLTAPRLPLQITSTTGPEHLWLAQATGPAAYNGTIYLQVGPQVTRDQAIGLAQKLGASGYPVEGGDKGGEKVDAMPDETEVRFFHSDDQKAATDLARALHAIDPARPVYVRDFSALGRIAPKGNLEIWVNDISAPGTDS